MVDTSHAITVGEVLEVEISCAANASSVDVALYTLTASGRTLVHSATLSTDLPASTVFLGPKTLITPTAAETHGVHILWWWGKIPYLSTV